MRRSTVRSRFIHSGWVAPIAAVLCASVTSASSASAQRPRFYVALDPGTGLTPAQLATVDAALSEGLAAERSIMLHRAGESAATASAIILARGLLGRRVSWTAGPAQTVNGVFALEVEVVCSPYPVTGASGSPPERFRVTVTLPGARTLDDLLPSLGGALSEAIIRSLR